MERKENDALLKREDYPDYNKAKCKPHGHYKMIEQGTNFPLFLSGELIVLRDIFENKKLKK